MGATESYNLLYESWRTKKASCIIQSQSRPKAENQELHCMRAGGGGPPSSRKESKHLSFLQLFCSIWARRESDDDCPHWWGQIFITWSTGLSLLETSSQTNILRNKFYQLSWYPLVQSTWHMIVNIIVSLVNFFTFLVKSCMRIHRIKYVSSKIRVASSW